MQQKYLYRPPSPHVNTLIPLLPRDSADEPLMLPYEYDDAIRAHVRCLAMALASF